MKMEEGDTHNQKESGDMHGQNNRMDKARYYNWRYSHSTDELGYIPLD